MNSQTGIARQTLIPVITALLLVWIAQACSDTETDDVVNYPGFFTSIEQEGPITSALIFNLDSVLYYNDKDSDKEIDGTLSLQLDSLLEVPVEIRTRGVTRRQLCPFPPLRVQIKKAAIADHKWGPFRNYKLVTHCSDSLRDEELLLREYLVYQLYDMLTPISFKTQLLKMQYVFPRDTIKRFAFLIENEEEMNHRLGLEEIDPEKEKITRIHIEHYKRFVLFQYMIGNTDWNLGTGHNTKYVRQQDSQTPIVIPYDFDYCGLVNASYARPYETLPIENVRERYFMYRGKKADDFTGVISEFVALKDDWYQMVEGFPYISEEGKQDILAWLDGFFGIIEKPDWKEQAFPS